MAEPDRKTWRDEPIVAVMSFIGAAFISIFVITTVWVGSSDIDPRVALVDSLAPSALLGVLAASFRPTRRLFSRWYISG